MNIYSIFWLELVIIRSNNSIYVFKRLVNPFSLAIWTLVFKFSNIKMAVSDMFGGNRWKKKLSPILSPGWKILIRQLPSDHLFYCNFLRRIRFRSSLAHRKTPWGVKSAFLGQKPHFQGWKNQFFTNAQKTENWIFYIFYDISTTK